MNFGSNVEFLKKISLSSRVCSHFQHKKTPLIEGFLNHLSLFLNYCCAVHHCLFGKKLAPAGISIENGHTPNGVGVQRIKINPMSGN